VTSEIDKLLDDLIAREGGFVKHQADRGGATKYGITASTLGLSRGLHRRATVDEIKALTVDEAKTIYEKQYILYPGFDKLPEWIMPIVVDDGVMSGPRTAAKTLQTALGVTQDGLIGAETVRVAREAHPQRVIVEYARLRLLRYARIVEKDPTQAAFFEGWVGRAFVPLQAMTARPTTAGSPGIPA
jgi:lysozyme family protein